MTTTAEGFSARVARLRTELAEQFHRAQAMIESAFEAAFLGSAEQAASVIKLDEPIDRVDVEIEKACVELLTDACAKGAQLPPDQVRMVLTVSKVNNELERIADVGVSIAEEVALLVSAQTRLPETFRVMANSMIGIVRDTGLCFGRNDAKLAKVVLASEDAVEAFKKSILRDAQTQVVRGTINVDQAFTLQELATYCEVMAGHCTNIAEQVIYVSTGAIVRHMAGHWEQFELPE